MDKKKNSTVLDIFLRILTPLIYLFFWYELPLLLLGKEKVDATVLITLALPVMFIGVISKQTTWSIGGDKGIKGDNIGRKVRATIDRRGSFDIEGIDMDEARVQKVINSVARNPIFTDKQRHDG